LDVVNRGASVQDSALNVTNSNFSIAQLSYNSTLN